ncbi:MAG: S41 family peptidase [Candidatus Melainabacteria bacterium]|nr:S41 family peptidase [Candidatus Melainabacteria bacterium]
MDYRSSNFQKLRKTPPRRPHFLARFVLVSSVVAAAYVALFWYNYLYATPVELYHRVWQAARDNYFDKTTLKNWDRFEHRYDKLIKTNDDAIVYANKMLSTFADPFSALHSPTEMQQFAESQAERFVGLGVSLATVTLGTASTKYLAVVEVMPGSPARKAGIKPGDTIISIDGKESADMTVSELKSIAAERENQSTDVIVQRGKRKVRVTLVPAVVERTNVELMPSQPNVAVIAVRDFLKKNTADRVMKVLERTAHRQAIVLDMRDNPGGSVDECLRLASAFLDEGQLVTLNIRTPGAAHHREIYSLKPDGIEISVMDDDGKIERTRKQQRLRPIAARRPLIVLINGGSASATEMFSAALQDNQRARIVGTRSYGKGIAQAGLAMPNGTTLNLTCVHYYTPGGRFIGMGQGGSEIERERKNEGIKPDVAIRNNTGETAEPADAQRQRALELLADCR